jgi:tetraacyldisaccharide 4'-kinase
MPISWIYQQITGLRNRLYDEGTRRSADLGARTISVGNLTIGGTGKTPLVGYIAGRLLERGEIVCILSRGYKREEPGKRVLVSDGAQILSDARRSGDEPFELAVRLKGRAIVIADADRTSAGQWARKEFGVTAFILDDGFQHRQVKRDLDILCIDATDPWGGGRTLPAGRLRESAQGLKRADAVVITRADQVSDLTELRTQISNLNTEAQVFESHNRVSSIMPLDAAKATATFDRSKLAFAFCGIGNPQSFFDLLVKEGFNLAATQAFRDHHRFAQTDIDVLQRSVSDAGAAYLLTTSKDAVKLTELRFEVPCYVVGIDVVMDRADEFGGLI